MVDPNINWDRHLSTLRAKGIAGEELRKRVGYCIVMCNNQDLDIHRKIGVLVSGDKWSSYNEESWNEYLDTIEEKLKEINSLSTKLIHIPYISPEDIAKEANTSSIFRWIKEKYSLTDEEASVIVSLYGENIISQFCRENQYTRLKGKFAFLIGLKDWYEEKSLDPIKVKEYESKNLQKYFK